MTHFLPLYRSHKVVGACQIGSLIHGQYPGAVLVPVDNRIPPFTVSAEYLQKHKPESGGWFVQYDDGYQSWSPDKAFRDGYEPVPASVGQHDPGETYRRAAALEALEQRIGPSPMQTFGQIARDALEAEKAPASMLSPADLAQSQSDAMRGTHWRGEDTRASHGLDDKPAD